MRLDYFKFAFFDFLCRSFTGLQVHSSRSQVPWPSSQKYLVCLVMCLSKGDGGPVMLLSSNKPGVFIKSGLHFHFYF